MCIQIYLEKISLGSFSGWVVLVPRGSKYQTVGGFRDLVSSGLGILDSQGERVVPFPRPDKGDQATLMTKGNIELGPSSKVF